MDGCYEMLKVTVAICFATFIIAFGALLVYAFARFIFRKF